MISDFYNIAFSVYSVAQPQDDGGAIVLTESLKLSDVPGKLDLLSGSEVIYNEKKELEANYRLFCDEISVVETDVIEIGSNTYDIYVVDDTTLRGDNPHLEITLLLRR
ncbi:MAG: hypothetical protein GY853_09550 [PVC group bacterium]|nr:hypothetical protein [PVC group bacterium]